VHSFAQQPVGGAGRWGRVNGWAFASGNIHTHREVATEPVRAYTDALPYINARWFGFTPNDARNDAYFNATSYFRKRDLLNAGVRTPDGALVVPADAQPVQVMPDGAMYIGPRTRGATTGPKPVLIIPKDQLKRPQPKQASDKSMASASAAR
jgi:hypothetical protein